MTGWAIEAYPPRQNTSGAAPSPLVATCRTRPTMIS